MIRCKFVYAVLSGALLLQSTDALSQTQRTMTVSELFSLVETGSRQLRAQKSEVDVAHHAISEAKAGVCLMLTLRCPLVITATCL